MDFKKIFKRDFTMVVIGQIISLFGNQILRFALPLYLLNQTGSSALYGFVSAGAFIPMVLLCPIGGIIADRVNKRNIMVVLDFATAILTVSISLALGHFNLVGLLLVSLIILYAIQGTYHPTVQACIPALVPVDGIISANAIINLVTASATLLGPVIGGVLFAKLGIMPILYVGAACFAASAIMEIFIHIPYKKSETTGNIFVVGINDLKHSMKYMVCEQSYIFKVSGIMALINLFLCSMVTISVPVIITQRLGFSEEHGNLLYGIAEGCMAVGSILGGVSASALSKKIRVSKSPFILFFCAVPSLAIAAVLLLQPPAYVTYGVIIISCFIMMTIAVTFTIQMLGYLQIMVPQDMVGKVVGCAMSLTMCSNPIGQAMYGVLFDKLENHQYIMFIAAFVICTGISILSINTFKKMEKVISKVYH